jgi:hypothetical protein
MMHGDFLAIFPPGRFTDIVLHLALYCPQGWSS